jgi:hypothetical protein
MSVGEEALGFADGEVDGRGEAPPPMMWGQGLVGFAGKQRAWWLLRVRVQAGAAPGGEHLFGA